MNIVSLSWERAMTLIPKLSKEAELQKDRNHPRKTLADIQKSTAAATGCQNHGQFTILSHFIIVFYKYVYIL